MKKYIWLTIVLFAAPISTWADCSGPTGQDNPCPPGHLEPCEVWKGCPDCKPVPAAADVIPDPSKPCMVCDGHGGVREIDRSVACPADYNSWDIAATSVGLTNDELTGKEHDCSPVFVAEYEAKAQHDDAQTQYDEALLEFIHDDAIYVAACQSNGEVESEECQEMAAALAALGVEVGAKLDALTQREQEYATAVAAAQSCHDAIADIKARLNAARQACSAANQALSACLQSMGCIATGEGCPS